MSSTENSDRLLQHFMSQLRDEFFYAQHPTNEKVVKNPAIMDRIQKLLDTETAPTWDCLYQVERLLVYVRPRSRLENEADRRVAEAERHKLSAAAKYRMQLDRVNEFVDQARQAADKALADALATSSDAKAKPARSQAKLVEDPADNARRAILASVLDDLQWFYQQRIRKRKALWDSASNLLWFGGISLGIVALPFVTFIIERSIGTKFVVDLMQSFPNYGLFTAMSFGLLGAFFSRLISMQFATDMTVEDAENRYGLKSLAIRAGVGMCGAIIVYYLLGTELLGQTAKPNFTELSYRVFSVVSMLSSEPFKVLLPSPHWCLLVIWSFLAGFSERLVPESLARAEGQLGGAQR